VDTYQFQSMGVRQLFFIALRYYRENLLKLVGIAAPGTLIGGLAFQSIWIYGYAEIAGPQVLAAALPYTAVTVFQSLIVTAVGTFAISQHLLGRSTSIGEAYSQVLGSLFPLLGVLIIFMVGSLIFSTIATGIGLMVFIPGIVVYIWFCLAPPVVIIEREGGFGALRRSRVLVKGFFDKAFLFIVWLTLAEAFVVILVLSLPFLIGSFPGFPSLLSCLSICLSLPINAFRIVSTTMLYYDLRVRKEGYDVQVLAQELATPV
jgi:hypothetical protein